MTTHTCTDHLCPCRLVTDEDRQRQSPTVTMLLREQTETERLMARVGFASWLLQHGRLTDATRAAGRDGGRDG